MISCLGCAFSEPAPEYRTALPPPVPFSASGETIPADRWWIEFDNAALNRQVEAAFQGNYTLSVAARRLQAARALARREASPLFLQLNGVADVEANMGPGNDQLGTVWGLSASYQLDLWGRIQSRAEAEQLRAEATHEDYHAVALTLSAEVVRTWFALVEAHAQLNLLDAQIETNSKGLQAQEERFRQGLVRSPDVLRQQQLLEATLEQSVIVRARVETLEHQLAVLTGQVPQTAGFATGAKLPELPPLPHTGLPSELLMRRPDVRGDYLALMAADRDFASAISAQYPRIDLTGSLLNVAESPSTLFRDWFVSIGGQVIAPLLDGGQRRSEVERTAELAGQRFAEYGQTMLNAFREVEDGLALERFQFQRINHLEAQVRLAQQASVPLLEQYIIGDADYLDYLSTIQAQQRLQRELLSARLDLIQIRIGLYLALAGSFDTGPHIVVGQPRMAPPGEPMRSGVEELPRPVEPALEAPME